MARKVGSAAERFASKLEERARTVLEDALKARGTASPAGGGADAGEEDER